MEIEVAAYPRARMKLTQSEIPGDVDNNGRVDYADVLLVIAYNHDPSIVMPNGGDIRLGDVNGDGRTNMADAKLILQQIDIVPPSDREVLVALYNATNGGPMERQY